jgi:CobQ-like glutamine amidotransferase family enzyme
MIKITLRRSAVNIEYAVIRAFTEFCVKGLFVMIKRKATKRGIKKKIRIINLSLASDFSVS